MELSKNVLICVDQDIMLTALKFRMEKQGYNVIHVKSMPEAQVALGEKVFDLIIADLQIDGDSAINIANWSKKKKKGGKPPFLVMATLDDDGDVLAEVLDGGANDFIMKPFKPAELYFRINQIVPSLDV